MGWLTAEGIIAAEPTDCVLGAESGYAPGPHYTAAVDGPSEWLLELRANGVGVSASRNVFAPLQGEVAPVVCPHCGQVVELEDAATAQLGAQWKPFRDAIKAWLAGGADEVACPACGQVAGFNDWRWVSDWPFAVGSLGFTFWNWPKLNEPFIAQVASHLRLRVVVTGGKLQRSSCLGQPDQLTGRNGS